MASLIFHQKHRKIIHISLSVTLFFIGILYIFFQVTGVSAAVESLQTKDVKTLNAEQIDEETVMVNTKKSGLESQMVEIESQYSSNRALQISLYDEQDNYKALLTDWKALERIYKKYIGTLDDIEKIEVKIAKNNKEADKTKKEALEVNKSSLEQDIDEKIAQLQEKDETLAELTREELNDEIIIAGKNQTKEEYDSKKEEIKNAKKEKKTILRERSSIKKVLKTAGSYLSKLAKELEKRAGNLISETPSTQNTESTPNTLSNINNTTGTLGTLNTTGTLGTLNTTGTLGTLNTTGTLGTLNTTGTLGTLNTTGTLGTLNTTGTLGTLNTTGTLGTLNTTGTLGTLNTTGTLGTLNTTGTLGTLNTTGTLGTLNTTGTLGTPDPISEPNCLGTRPGNSIVLVSGSSTNVREWSYAPRDLYSPLPFCTFSCNGSYDSVLKNVTK